METLDRYPRKFRYILIPVLIMAILLVVGLATKSQAQQTFYGQGNATSKNVFKGYLQANVGLQAPKTKVVLPYFDSLGLIVVDSSGTLWVHTLDSFVSIAGGGGSGTVTSVGSGFGLTGGTITTSGTLRVDTGAIPTFYRLYKAVDSVAALAPVTPSWQDVLDVGNYGQRAVADTIQAHSSMGLHLHGTGGQGIMVGAGGGGNITFDAYPTTVPGDSVLTTNSSGGVLRYDLAGNYIKSTTVRSANTFLAGPVSGASAAPTFRVIDTTDLPAAGVSFGTVGSASAIPVITYDAKGRIRAVTTATVSAGGGSINYNQIISVPTTTLTITASATTVDSSGGVSQYVLLNGATTTININNLKNGATYTLIVQNDATPNRAITWQSGILVPGHYSGLPIHTADANAYDIYKIEQHAGKIFVSFGLDAN